MATVMLTKQSSAHRLLIAAINMFERGDDELATFVVASAAYSALRELVKVKGDSFQAQLLRAAIFADAKRKTLGHATLLPSTPELDERIDAVADRIRAGEIESEDDLKPLLKIANERELIKHQTDPYNFLKHADRDSSERLQEDQVDALGVIVSGLAAYSGLFPFETLPPEVSTFLDKHGIVDPVFATPL